MNAQENDRALLDAYSETVSDVAARASPAVVKIEAAKRGHGGSGDPGDAYPWSFDGLVKDLSAFCDALDLRNAHLLGESTGGMLAIGFAATHPARVRSLTLCGTPPTIGPAEQKFLAVGHDTWQGALTEMGSEGWARKLLSQPGTAPRGDEARTEWSIKQFARAKSESLVGYSRVISTTAVTPRSRARSWSDIGSSAMKLMSQ